MLISLNWLKTYISLPSKISPEEIAQKLTVHTVEVEKVESQAKRFDHVIVAKILEIQKHPRADRLQIAVVSDGKQNRTVVCGAPNIAIGQLVPLALPGAVLPNGMEIQETEVRGEKSEGMLCAEDELGLSSDHEGIKILTGAKVGQTFASYLKLNDIILEVDNKSLSNRPDLFSHYGIARELSAIFDVKLQPIDVSDIVLEKKDSDKEENKKKNKKISENQLEKLTVKVENNKLCPRYMAIRISGLTVEESPQWLKDNLLAIGQKPINNIVDVANFVMFSLGQPLHTFDADKVSEIVIRLAKKDETIETLDKQTRKLNGQELVIADSHKPIAIAGIIGGLESAVTKNTKNIIIESATFDGPTIRRTERDLSLRTEASVRFEKSLDKTLPEIALKLAVQTLKKINKKITINSQLTDIYPIPTETPTVELDINWMEKITGIKMEPEKIKNILEHLGFSIDNKTNDILNVKIPSWRSGKDVAIKEDLAEEVLRLFGYNNVPSTMPEINLSAPIKNEDRELENQIRLILAKETKLSESYNYSFTNEEELKKLGIDDTNHLKLANPLSSQHTLLRQSLVPGLINNIRTNQYRHTSLGIFEIGNIFLNSVGNIRKNDTDEEHLPFQEKLVGIVIAGNETDLFLLAKSIVQNMVGSLVSNQLEVSYHPTEMTVGYGDKNCQANITAGGQVIGTIAQLDSTVAKNSGLKINTVAVEISLNRLRELNQKFGLKIYHDIPKYPPLVRDLAFVVSEKIMYNDLRDEIKNFHPLISSVELFDVYSGKQLEPGQKNLAFHVIYQSLDRTLTAEEVDTIQKGLSESLQSKFSAQLRNF
jgi:phenylalanyl-tRNA synthetase beta chain